MRFEPPRIINSLAGRIPNVMKVFRHFNTALAMGTLVALAALSSGCEYARKVIAKDKLNQGAIMYNQGRTKEAQTYFKDALDTFDQSPVAWLYYGATLVKDYKSLSGQARDNKANEALNAYKKALDLAGGNCKVVDNAISYIATIYEDMGKPDERREWLLKRAEGECSDKDIKATTYYTIGVNYWNCAYDQTTRYQDKAAKDPFHFRNMDYPAALPDKQKAEDCITKGLEYVEKALAVDPEYVDAYFYKGLLYRERQKLAKEESERKKLADMAQKMNDEGTALQKKKEEAAKQQQQASKPQG